MKLKKAKCKGGKKSNTQKPPRNTCLDSSTAEILVTGRTNKHILSMRQGLDALTKKADSAVHVEGIIYMVWDIIRLLSSGRRPSDGVTFLHRGTMCFKGHMQTGERSQSRN